MSATRTVAPEPLLAVEQLRTRFPSPRGWVRAVDGVDLTLTRGRTLGIVGESGSGKTVLSRTIMGLFSGSQAEVTGSVRYADRELVGAQPGDLRDVWGLEMAMVFQDPMTSLNPVLRIGEQITESLRHHVDMPKDEARATALALLRAVGIPEPERRLRQYAHELSGGMRQRIIIAIALACGPRLLLADEPTTALDVTVQAQILDLLARERADRQMALILVTHDLGVVARHTDEIAVMYAGQIVERAPTRRLFAMTQMPYTAALLGSIPKLDQPRHTRLPAIPGRPPDLIGEPSGCRFASRCERAEARCRAEEPPLVPTQSSPEHWYRCWFPLEGGI